MGFAETVCPSCHMHIVASGFCPNCGMALTAAPNSIKRSRRPRNGRAAPPRRRSIDGCHLREVRHPEPGRQPVLPGVRHAACRGRRRPRSRGARTGSPPPGPPPPGSARAGLRVATGLAGRATRARTTRPARRSRRPPVHRTPWVLIIGAIVVLDRGDGRVRHRDRALRHTSTANDAGGVAYRCPSPSPAGSPSPMRIADSARPHRHRLPRTTGWRSRCRRAGRWIDKDSESITLSNPNGDGSITIGSGPSSPRQTAQQNKDTVDKFFAEQVPGHQDLPRQQDHDRHRSTERPGSSGSSASR